MNLQNDWVVAIGSYSLYDLYTKTLSIRKKRFGSVLYLTFQRYCGKSEDGYRIMENKKGIYDYNRRYWWSDSKTSCWICYWDCKVFQLLCCKQLIGCNILWFLFSTHLYLKIECSLLFSHLSSHSINLIVNQWYSDAINPDRLSNDIDIRRLIRILTICE